MFLKLLQIDGEMTTFLRTFFFKENKQNPEIWYCCFHFYIKLLTCIYNKSVHCISTAFVIKRHDILVSNTADVLLFYYFFRLFKLQ